MSILGIRLHNQKNRSNFAAVTYSPFCIVKFIRQSFLLFALWTGMPLVAQIYGAGSSVYSFLGLPGSSRLAALGGENVAIQDGEITSALINPSLLSGTTHHALSLNYGYHVKGTMGGVAMYGYNFRRSSLEKQVEEDDRPNRFAAAIHFMDYGKMPYASADGTLTGGEFTAKDILIDLVYARQLGPMFTVGVSLKPIMSFYERYSSFALAADVGGHFQTKDSLLHIGLAFRNIGWQLKGFYTREGGQQREQLPFNLELGLSYRVKHAPLRFSVTIHNMQRWNLDYEFTNQPRDTKTKVEWYDMMFRHMVFALDIIPKSERFYLTVSYNHRHRAEMQLKDQRSLAGFALAAFGATFGNSGRSASYSKVVKNSFW